MSIASRIENDNATVTTQAANEAIKLTWESAKFQMIKGTHAGASVYLPDPDATRDYGEVFVTNLKGASINITIDNDVNGENGAANAVLGGQNSNVGNSKTAHCVYLPGTDINGQGGGQWIVHVSA